ncbi:hypothetical protein E4U55_006959 [Claviceps digitariae]|nr:hypothetical protein E4U55_006959 [Claviceps digitariae]
MSGTNNHDVATALMARTTAMTITRELSRNKCSLHILWCHAPLNGARGKNSNDDDDGKRSNER